MVLPGGIYSLEEETNNYDTVGEKWKIMQSSNSRHIYRGLKVWGDFRETEHKARLLKTAMKVWRGTEGE